MEILRFEIEGLVELVPRVFHDERGYFFESYNQQTFDQALGPVRFVQDNQSYSQKGVLRGMHLQRPPFAQAKLVRAISGRILDVAVDLRPGSPTFGQHVSVELDSERQNMLYIPEGFAHGFLALSDSLFAYKCSNFYQKSAEGGLRYDDPALGIDWPVDHPIVSDKDLELPMLSAFEPLEA